MIRILVVLLICVVVIESGTPVCELDNQTVDVPGGKCEEFLSCLLVAGTEYNINYEFTGTNSNSGDYTLMSETSWNNMVFCEGVENSCAATELCAATGPSVVGEFSFTPETSDSYFFVALNPSLLVSLDFVATVTVTEASTTGFILLGVLGGVFALLVLLGIVLVVVIVIQKKSKKNFTSIGEENLLIPQ